MLGAEPGGHFGHKIRPAGLAPTKRTCTSIALGDRTEIVFLCVSIATWVVVDCFMARSPCMSSDQFVGLPSILHAVERAVVDGHIGRAVVDDWCHVHECEFVLVQR